MNYDSRLIKSQRKHADPVWKSCRTRGIPQRLYYLSYSVLVVAWSNLKVKVHLEL